MYGTGAPEMQSKVIRPLIDKMTDALIAKI
jgi:hypothetical protein